MDGRVNKIIHIQMRFSRMHRDLVARTDSG